VAGSNQAAPAGVITRNSYRCMVLNAARMFIADVDRGPTEAAAPRAGILQTLFGRDRKSAETDTGRDLHASSVLQRVVEVVDRDSDGLAFVYETAGGLRIILAIRRWILVPWRQREFSASSGAIRSIFLFVVIKSRFAQLTPKPWRCGHHAPTERWPFLETKSEELRGVGK